MAETWHRLLRANEFYVFLVIVVLALLIQFRSGQFFTANNLVDLAHRIVLGFDAVADNVSTTDVVERILAMVPAPTPVWNDQSRQQRHQQHGFQPVAPYPGQG